MKGIKQMKIVEGKFNSAKVFTDVVEEGALAQIKTLCDQEFMDFYRHSACSHQLL